MYMQTHMWGYVDNICLHMCIYTHICRSICRHISIFACVCLCCACMYPYMFSCGMAHVLAWMHMYLCAPCVWRPKVVLRCFPPLLSTKYTEAVALSWAWSLPSQLSCLPSVLWGSPSYGSHTLGLQSGHHACLASPWVLGVGTPVFILVWQVL